MIKGPFNLFLIWVVVFKEKEVQDDANEIRRFEIKLIFI